MHRFFISPSEIQGSDFFIKNQNVVHQILRVLRMKTGDKFLLLDNLGNEILAELLLLKSNEVRVRAISLKQKAENPKFQVTLFMSILKKNNFELVLQKCTELGVDAFQPIITERTIKVKSDVPQRWLDIIREASEQSGRVFMPKLYPPRHLKDILSNGLSGKNFIAHEKEEAIILTNEISKINQGATVNIFIGPEGGFSEREKKMAQAVSAIPVKLGANILRAETAAIAACSILLIQ